MKIAVVGNFDGCKLNKLYEKIEKIKKDGISIDLVMICGNFQAARNKNDLKCIDCLDCWRNLGDFHEYYSGKRKASQLTLVIGGNEEVSNYFKTLPYGGWIAPNIYYMGYSNVIKFNGLRIGGLSGTSNKLFDYLYKIEITKAGYFERLPFDLKDKRTICYTRYLDIYRMLQMKSNLDIIFTFDWPLGVLNDDQLMIDCLKKIPFPFQNKDLFNNLGSLMYKDILDQIKPKHWFAGKLRLTLNKTYRHNSNEVTIFHSLNKYQPKEELQIFEINSDLSNKNGLEYDIEWLSILKATNQYVSIEKAPTNQPPDSNVTNDLIKEYEKFIALKFNGKFNIPENFKKCLPIYLFNIDIDPQRKKNYTNKQTESFCKLLQLSDLNQLILNMTENSRKKKYFKFRVEFIGWISKLLHFK